MALTKQQQAVADILVAGTDGFGDRIKAHSDRLVAEGDIVGLCEFTEALVQLGRELRGVTTPGDTGEKESE